MANSNLDEILEKFQNGDRRYEEDPIFKSAVDSLVKGLGVYAVLDHTLKELNRMHQVAAEQRAKLDAHESTLDRMGRSSKIVPERDTFCGEINVEQ